ncbi:2-amino-4-hydroxy-6-hydroxymethyldihydropteridine diphosphokinase [Aureimonas endophytica]|uniref:2-amino-4-hydroxy-6-hydroxymethyldihydropteridine pyrophosphokinase n=1 Tax=Aureimonas endophytica TaxID=2027858 RepID=A0A916ZE33_9HYPH|nr:2-amino-4-hydroxy-6-hydroxymethyldihydropteridine diphosphokinase [Aureimonas endophytica]GGD91252.1 2-amino-4-hydroxy-6-hydroxymethyldihydropteridine diphosphokinase [Aureimonas endophytica]
MTRALLGLGGNLGDPVANMRMALRALDARPDIAVSAVSRLYRTPPWGKTDQPPFVNAVASLDTALAPHALLEAGLAVERGLKRERLERWGPRTIDLDILDMEGVVLADAALTLPHPRMGERAFVLIPLADVAPDFRIDGVPIAARLAELDRAGIEALGDDRDWWKG